MNLRYITNLDLKLEVMKYLQAYKSYLIKCKRAKKEYIDQCKTQYLSSILYAGVEVEVIYKGKKIKGKVVGFPEGRSTFCLESFELDGVSPKEYSNNYLGFLKGTMTAKRRYFPVSRICSLPRHFDYELSNLIDKYKDEPFTFEFKLASEDLQNSLKTTVVTRKAVDQALKDVQALKFRKIPGSPEERLKAYEKAVSEGYKCHEVIEFLYNKKPTIGFSLLPYWAKDHIFVVSPYIKSYGFGKYIRKDNFISWVKDKHLKAQMEEFQWNWEDRDVVDATTTAITLYYKANYSMYRKLNPEDCKVDWDWMK